MTNLDERFRELSAKFSTRKTFTDETIREEISEPSTGFRNDLLAKMRQDVQQLEITKTQETEPSFTDKIFGADKVAEAKKVLGAERSFDEIIDKVSPQPIPLKEYGKEFKKLPRELVKQLPIAGMSGAALLATPTTPVGQVAAGALGYAGGARLQRGIESLMGWGEPESVGEAFKSAAGELKKGAMYSMGGQIGGTLIGKGLDKASAALSKGNIPPEQILANQKKIDMIFRAQKTLNKDDEWVTSMVKKHVKANRPAWIVEKLQSVLNPWDKYSAYDQAYGTRLGQATQEAYTNVNKVDNQAVDLIARATTLRQKLINTGMTPEQLGEMLDKGQIPKGEVFDIVREHFKLYKDLLAIKKDLHPAMRTKLGYELLSKRTKVPIVHRTTDAPSIITKQTGTPSIGYLKHMAKERPYAEDIYIKDPFENFISHVTETQRSAALSDSVLEKVRRGMAVLKINNQDKKVAEVSEWLKSFTGYGGTPRDNALSLEMIMSTSDKKELQTMMDAFASDNSTIGKQVYRRVQGLMHAHLVGANPLSNVKQTLQNSIVAPGEVGPKIAARAEAFNAQILAGQTQDLYVKEMLNAFNTVKSGLRGASGVDPTEMTKAPVSSKIFKIIDKYTNTLMSLFTGGDYNNIRKGFIGGYDQITQGGVNSSTLEGLLPAQKASVMEAYKIGGKKAAAIANGVIRTLRENFMYSPIDKPAFLRKGLGEYIPFTTWSRNQWNRVIGDLSQGNLDNIAKRIAYPIIFLQTLRNATGFEIPNASTWDSMRSIAQSDIAPVIKRPLERASKGDILGAGEELASMATPYSFYKRYEKYDKAGNLPEGIIGLKEADQDEGFLSKILSITANPPRKKKTPETKTNPALFDKLLKSKKRR